MKNISAWESMGMLDAFDLEYEKEQMINLYEDISKFIKTQDFNTLSQKMHIEDWWNSYLPNTNEEWETKTGMTEGSLEELKEICMYEKGILINLLFDTAQDMCIKYGVVFNVNDILSFIKKINLEPLRYTGEKAFFRTYGVLYDAVSQIVLEKCSTIHKINTVIKNTSSWKNY